MTPASGTTVQISHCAIFLAADPILVNCGRP
jgi:hypothetical protein